MMGNDAVYEYYLDIVALKSFALVTANLNDMGSKGWQLVTALLLPKLAGLDEHEMLLIWEKRNRKE